MRFHALCVTASVFCLLAQGTLAGMPGVEPNGIDTGGDNSPTPIYSFLGKGGIARAVALAGTSGTFTLGGIPVGATVDRAYYIATHWSSSSGQNIDFTFHGSPYGAVLPTTVDPGGGYEVGAYVIDVTSDVTGNGSYSFLSIPSTTGPGMPGHLLLVIYADPAGTFQSIKLNAGAENLAGASSTSIISGVAAGSGTLHIFVGGDDPGNPGDALIFNGLTILSGDIFNANQGLYATYLEVPVTTVDGDNTVTVTDGGDWFAWQVAALISPAAPAGIDRTSWSKVKSRYR